MFLYLTVVFFCYVTVTLLFCKMFLRRFCTKNVLNNFENDFEKYHCNTNLLQKGILTVGSAAISILNPYRGDMIATMGETTGHNALKYIQSRMYNSNEGKRILQNKPRINTSTVDLDYLKTLPENTLGKTYYDFLQKHKVTPDERTNVQFVDDMELAYVIQRYREIHDLIHAILRMPTNMLGEVTVKWVEAIQFRLPMCVGGAIFGPVRLKVKHRDLYRRYYMPWGIKTGLNAEFLMNIYFEKRWEQDMGDFYKEFNIEEFKINK